MVVVAVVDGIETGIIGPSNFLTAHLDGAVLVGEKVVIPTCSLLIVSSPKAEITPRVLAWG